MAAAPRVHLPLQSLLLLSHRQPIITIIARRVPGISHDCTCFGSRPGRFSGLYLEIGSVHVFPPPIGFSVNGFQLARLKVSFLFPMRKYPLVDDLGSAPPAMTPRFQTWKLMEVRLLTS